MPTLTKRYSSVESARTSNVTNPANAIDSNAGTYSSNTSNMNGYISAYIEFSEFSGNEIISEIRFVTRMLGQDSGRTGTNLSFQIYDYPSGGSGEYYAGARHPCPYTTTLHYFQWRVTATQGVQENISSPATYSTINTAWGRASLGGGTLDISNALNWKNGLYVRLPQEFNGLTGRYVRCYDAEIQIDYESPIIIRVNDGGIWKESKPYAKDGAIWKEATPYANHSGIWKQTI